MTSKNRWSMAALSDTGRQRTKNEDRYLCDPVRGLAMVADGIGGHRAGEIASSLTVTLLDKLIHQNTQPLLPEQIRQIFIETNLAIHQLSLSQPQYQGMGSAVILALFQHQHVTVAHVGDCRLYRLRGHSLECLTKDHTLYQDLLNQGHSSAQAREVVSPHTLSQAMGSATQINPTIDQFSIHTEDLFLLCSDGLTDMLLDEEIQTILQSKWIYNMNKNVQQLVHMANHKGGADNITAILIQAKSNYPFGFEWFQNTAHCLQHKLFFKRHLHDKRK
ncbi:MAG: protein phosphatase 2C domain-containing protein [Magnetococcus sp. DMHC-6]